MTAITTRSSLCISSYPACGSNVPLFILDGDHHRVAVVVYDRDGQSALGMADGAWAGPMFAQTIDVVVGEVIEPDRFTFADVLPLVRPVDAPDADPPPTQ